MNSPLLTLGSIFVISVLSPVYGYTAEISTCASTVSRGSPCFIHCSVTGLQETDYFGVSKVGVTYYGLFNEKFEKVMDVGYYDKKIGLNPKLPERYQSVESDNEVNISISGIMPEDMGDFICAIMNENGETIQSSASKRISVTGTPVEQYWERLDESGNPVERFEDDEEITIIYEDIPSLALRIAIDEPMGSGILPTYVLDCDDRNGFPWRMNDWFSFRNDTSEKIDSETGLVNDFNSSALYYSPTDLPLLPYFTVQFQGYFAFQEPPAPTVTLWLEVQASPWILNLECNRTMVAEIDGSILFVCGMLSNPEPTSFALKVPGREELIESEDLDERFKFEVKKSENTNTPYRYTLHLTYNKITDEVFGSNTLYARNDIDESTYSFTIDAGHKPGLPLLLSFISTLIAIVSSVSRF